jgi:hypothetical protein
MCAWDNHFCWPGKCYGDLTRRCSCAPDFQIRQQSWETTCQPRKRPSILSCGTVAHGPKTEKKRFQSSTYSTACQYLNDIYGNFKPSSFKVDITAEYTIKLTGYTQPDFISESRFGITDFSTNVVKKYINGKKFSRNYKM